MLDKLRQLTSIGLIVAMVLFLFTPTTVGAVIPGEDSMIGNQGVTYRVFARDVSNKIIQDLTEYQIRINDDSVFEVIPLALDENATALAVTTMEGSSFTRSTIFALNKEGEPQSVIVEQVSPTSELITIGDEENVFGDESFLGIWAVQYNIDVIQSRYCSQPKYAQFMYRNSGGHNVQSFNIEYFTAGAQYTYPGGVLLDADAEHVMTISSNSPVANRYYVNSNAFASNRRICVDHLGEHVVNVNFRIDGRNYFWPTPLPFAS